MKIQIAERDHDILEWDAILKELQSRCDTIKGKSFALTLCPLSMVDIKLRLKQITELKESIIHGEFPEFSGITDIEPFLNIAIKDGVLSLDELSQIKDFIIASKRVRNFIKINREKFISISEEFKSINNLNTIGDLIIDSITDLGVLNTDKYPELRRIGDDIFNTKKQIEKILQDLIYSPSMDKVLQEKIYTTRNERYVILLKSNMKERINGTVHDISSSGGTLFVEPAEISGLNNRLIMFELNLQIQINKILRQLSEGVGKHSDELLDNLKIISYFDFLTAASKFSISIKGNEPEISDDNILRLYNARHPLLYLMSPDTVVSNDISLGEDFNCLIISGANTGGKTVLLKTIGLCALLIIYGLHIPVTADSRIGIFSNILTYIGDEQSIVQSLSTFSGQIIVLREMIEKADSRSLILIDEMVVGTSPRHGAALAQSILEEIIESEARIVVTTHYTELKKLSLVDKRFINASVSFDIETLNPTYRLKTGTPGLSYTLEIAEIYGINERILSRSREFLDSTEISMDALLEKIRKEESRIEEDKERIRLKEEELRKQQILYDKEQMKLNQKMEELKKEKGIIFLEELDKYKDMIRQRIKNLQVSDLKTSGELHHEVIRLEKEISDRLKRDGAGRFTDRYVSFDPDVVEVGDRVFIVSLEREGKVESIDILTKNVYIILGNLVRARYKFQDIMIPLLRKKAGKFIKQIEIANNESSDDNISLPTIQTRYNTIDLRGLRVDDAINKVEQDFDKMLINRIRSVIIIHGHGTGALKKAVRSRLKFSPYVKDYRPGEREEGGDGVTITLLKD